MVRIRWGMIDGRLTALRRGCVARVWCDPKDRRHWMWMVTSPSKTAHIGTAKSEDSARRKARKILLRFAPEATPAEQLGLPNAM